MQMDGERLDVWTPLDWEEITWFVDSPTALPIFFRQGDLTIEILPLTLSRQGDSGLFLTPSASPLRPAIFDAEIAALNLNQEPITLPVKLYRISQQQVSYLGIGFADSLETNPESQQILLEAVPLSEGIRDLIGSCAGWSELDVVITAGDEQEFQTGTETLPGKTTARVRKSPAEAERFTAFQQAQAAKQQYGKMSAAAKGQATGKVQKRATMADVVSLLENMQVQMGTMQSRMDSFETKSPPGPPGLTPPNMMPNQPGFMGKASSPYPQGGSSSSWMMGPPPLGGHGGPQLPPANTTNPPQQEDGTVMLAKALSKLMGKETQDQNLYGETELDVGSLAKGSASVASIINAARTQAPQFCQAFEQQIKEAQHVYYPNQPWSVEGHSRDFCKQLQGQRVAKKMLVSIGHAYDMGRLEGASPALLAYLAQVYKATTTSMIANGDWTLGWELTGLQDPEDALKPITLPAERTALTALKRERDVIKKNLTNPDKQKEKDKEKDQG